MLKYPVTYSRGAPDLMFWRIHQLGVSRKDSLSQTNEQNEIILTHSLKIQNQNESVKILDREEPYDYDDVFAVEVKSVNDVLSNWQYLWLQLLKYAGIPVEVLKVISIE